MCVRLGSNKMKSIYETSDYTDALIKKGMLEQAGFLVYVDNLNSGGVMPHMGIALGYIIQVPDSDAEEAAQFLAVPYTSAKAPSSEENIDTCPQCGSTNIVRYRSILWLPLLWVLGILFPAAGGRHRRCADCGHSYKLPGSDLGTPFKLLIIFTLFWLLLAYLLSENSFLS